MNDSKNIINNDNIDLTAILISLWRKKWFILASTLLFTILAVAWHATLPTRWVASSYIITPSTYDFYKDVHMQAQAPEVNHYGFSQAAVYLAIKTEIFATAVGVLTLNGVSVGDPSKGSNIYTVSLISNTEESARAALKKSLETANAQAIASSLPDLAADNKIKAFTNLGDISTAPVKRGLLGFVVLGVVFGFFAGCALVLCKEFIEKLVNASK